MRVANASSGSNPPAPTRRNQGFGPGFLFVGIFDARGDPDGKPGDIAERVMHIGDLREENRGTKGGKFVYYSFYLS